MRDRWGGLLLVTVLASVLLLTGLTGCQAPQSAASISLTPISDLTRATSPSTVTEGVTVPTTLAEVPRIEPEELKDQLDSGEKVAVVDARSRASYARRHIPGALSIPLPELEEHLDELLLSGDIVFYCT